MEMKEKLLPETEFPTIESEKDNPLEDTLKLRNFL